MRNIPSYLPASAVKVASWSVASLGVAYIALIAAVMSYAALTIEFSQSVRNDEASVALLESQYLASVAQVTNTDYAAQGYNIPAVKTFVKGKSVTALR